MRRILLTWSVIASLSLAAAGRSRADDGPLPSESVLARSQPGVFLLVTYADYNVTIPRKVALVDGPGKTALVFADYEALQAAGKIAAGAAKRDVLWVLIAKDPGRYLRVAERESKREPLEIYGSGTAFAVSQEGILLTNAHNIADPPDGSVPIRAFLGVLDRTVDELSGTTAIEALIGKKAEPKPPGNILNNPPPSLGGRPPASLSTPLIQNLYKWMLGESSSKGNKFREVLVVLDYRDRPDPARPGTLVPHYRPGSPETQQALQTKFDALALGEMLGGKVQGRFATVLARGEEYPGKDVAVLKLRPEAPGGKVDAIVCLPLGDSDRVQSGSNVLAVGFPGAAFDPVQMKESARFRAIAEDGKITQRIPYKSGVEFFHMTAQINHGHSGGPVVDPSGRVVAINVAGLENSNVRLAVPINVAREFLDKAGIKPDPGPLGNRWLVGHDLFQKKDFAGAEREFNAVADLQEPGRNRGELGVAGRMATGGLPVNSYVEAMIRECRVRAAGR